MPDDQEDDPERLRRLDAGLHRIDGDRATWVREHVLALVAGALVPLGLLLVLFGWRGASRTPNVYEQVPYLISGGELGQTLAVVGALCYFAHWITALLREQRTQGAALSAAILHLEDAVARLAPPASAPPELVATSRGTLVHRLGCSVVAGKDGLRTVTGLDGLAPCRLCLPDGVTDGA